jgi:hypothetical protein
MTVEAKKVTWFLQTEHIVGKVEIADRSPKTHSLSSTYSKRTTLVLLAVVERGRRHSNSMTIPIFVLATLHLSSYIDFKSNDYKNCKHFQTKKR